MENLTEQQIENWKKQIDDMSHRDLAALQRFAPAGHPVFRSDLPLYAHFQNRFKSFGGMTPQISKEVGW